MNNLIFSLRAFFKKNNTYSNRRENLYLSMECLIDLGYKIQDIKNLKKKHIDILVQLWKKQQTHIYVIGERIEDLRWLTNKIGKARIVERDNIGYGKEFEITCPYCNTKAELVSGNVIYPYRIDLENSFYYLCSHCNAYVGTHKESKYPLGMLANENLRKMRLLVHRSMDQLWKSKMMTRNKVYSLLAYEMNIKKEETHIGLFDLEKCSMALDIISAYKEYISYVQDQIRDAYTYQQEIKISMALKNKN